MNFKIHYGVMGCLVAALVAGHAQTVNVNLVGKKGLNPMQTLNGTSYAAGISPMAYTGNYWTDTGSLKAEGLSDSNGIKTSIGYQFKLQANRMIVFSNPTAGKRILANYLAVRVAEGAPPPTISTITIQGLEPARAYDIALVSQGDQKGQGGEFTIDGILKISTGTLPAGGLEEGVSYVEFKKIAASGKGTINITWKSRAETEEHYAILNAFQIVPSKQNVKEVPETTSYASLFFP
ncbi:MAG: hypothetical protein AAGH72_02985 [Verrucomicrobiota bacterium]